MWASLRQLPNRLRTRWERMAVWFRVVVMAVLLLAILGGSALDVRELAKRVADQVTVTITQTSGTPYGVVFHQAFGRSVAAQMENLLNDHTAAPRFDPGGSIGTGDHPTWDYHFVFTLYGVTLESASTEYQMEPEAYTISVLGVTQSRRVGWLLIDDLSNATHGAVPLPPNTD